MHMWVIYVGRHLSRGGKNRDPTGTRTQGLSLTVRALYHVAINAGLYRKAVQVYYIPDCDLDCLQRRMTFVPMIAGTVLLYSVLETTSKGITKLLFPKEGIDISASI